MLHTTPLRIFLASVLALALTACGGGGGGAGGPSAPGVPQPTVPPQPGETLQVVHVVPAVGATDVQEDTAIELAFDAPLDPASFGAAPIIVKDAMGDVAGTTTYLPEQNRLRFVPDAPLALGMHYEARTAAGLEDVEGNRRNDEFEWSFDTRLPQLQPGPDPYEAESERTRLRTFELNQSGQGWVVYLQGESFGPNQFVAKRYGASLGAGRYGLHTGIDMRTNPDMLAMNASGATILGYTEDAGDTRDAHVHAYDAATGTWGGRIPMENSPAYEVGTMKVAISDSGDILVGCTRAPVGTDDYRLWVRPYRAGLGWLGIMAVDAGLGRVNRFELAFNDAGDAMIGWNEAMGSETRIHARTWSSSAGFGAIQEVAGQATVHHDIAGLLLDEDGFGYVTYNRRTGTTHQAWLRRYVPPGELAPGWQPATPLQPTSADYLLDAQCLLGSDGAASFAVISRTDGESQIWASRYQRGVGLSTPLPLAPAGVEAQSDELALAAGPNGRMTVGYGIQLGNDDVQVWTITYVPQAGWQAPVLVFELPDPHYLSSLSLSARSSGDVYAFLFYQVSDDNDDESIIGRWISPEGERGPLDVIVLETDRTIGTALFRLDGMGVGSVLWDAVEAPDVRYDIFERQFR